MKMLNLRIPIWLVQNNFLHSLFSQIEVAFNNQVVENTNAMYPYLAYINNTYCHGKEAKNTHLQREGYYPDEPPLFDSTVLKKTETASPNPGFLSRRSELLKEGSIEMIGKPHLNILKCNTLLLNNLQINFHFTRTNEKFCLMADNLQQYTVLIKKAILRVRRVRMAPEIMLNHAMMLEKTNAKYPIRDVSVKAATIQVKTQGITINDFSTGVIPRRLIFALVDSSAYSGSNKKNPFDFQHFDLQSIELKVGGNALPYASALEFNFNQGNYQLAYNSLFQGIHDTPNNMYALYAFAYPRLVFRRKF
jgi:hypothetical protein